jgi:hypothetical protein
MVEGRITHGAVIETPSEKRNGLRSRSDKVSEAYAPVLRPVHEAHALNLYKLTLALGNVGEVNPDIFCKTFIT